MRNYFKEAKKLIDIERTKDPKLLSIIRGFVDENNLKSFIKKCLRKRRARWMLNRLQWLVELADWQKYDNVKVLFLIAMAEVNIKLLENRFKDNTRQTEDARMFFEKFLRIDREFLRKRFIKHTMTCEDKFFSFTTIVDILINVRHRVTHGKFTYDFKFSNGNDGNLLNGEIGTSKRKRTINYNLNLTYSDFRKIMIKYAIKNIEKCLKC